MNIHRPAATVIFLLAFSALPFAQDANPTIYAESFRHGATRVTEDSFEMKLTPDNPNYREFIKDTGGNDRYVFTAVPQILEGDNEITSWRVKLADLHYPIYPNVLLRTQESSSDVPNNLWRLDPSRFAIVPVRARRIIKVDNFYVTLQIKAYHFTPLDSPYLDSMTVQVEFRNSDPRPAQKP